MRAGIIAGCAYIVRGMSGKVASCLFMHTHTANGVPRCIHRVLAYSVETVFQGATSNPLMEIMAATAAFVKHAPDETCQC